MDPIDLTPLEFSRGQAIAREMISHVPKLHPVQREMMDFFVRQPHAFFVEDNDFADPIEENLSSIRQWMFSAFQRAPQVLYDRFKALESSARRFGTWDSMLLEPSRLTNDDGDRWEYTPRLSADEISAIYSEISPYLTLQPIDGKLAFSIFTMLQIIGSKVVGPNEAKVDIDNGKFIFGPDADEEIGAATGHFSRPFGGRVHLSHLKLQRLEANEIAVQMDRKDPVFDPFEAYAKRVKIGKMGIIALLGADSIEVTIGKDRRPADEPLLYEFTPEAKRWSSLPQDETLWRVEATFRDDIHPDYIPWFLNTWHSKVNIGPAHVFLESAGRLFDLRKRDEARLVEREIVPGETLSILATGEEARDTLIGAWKAIRGEEIESISTGGGAGGDRCRIMNKPMMPEALGFNPGVMAMGGMMAVRAVV